MGKILSQGSLEMTAICHFDPWEKSIPPWNKKFSLSKTSALYIIFGTNMPIDISPYIVRFKQREKVRRATLMKRHDKAWELALTAAELLRNSFRAKRVVVFGSIIQAKLFHLGSDVDLSVWGLYPDVYFGAVGQLQALDPETPIDLVMFEDAPESLKRVIHWGPF